MKNLCIDNKNMNRNDGLGEFFGLKVEGICKNSVMHYSGCEVFSDSVGTSTANIPVVKSIQDYVGFITSYIRNVLDNNPAALERKKPPYNLFVSLHLDTCGRQSKLYFYVDGDVFGLLVGAGHVNIGNLIKASFPIFSKTGYDIEVKVFSTFNKNRHDSVESLDVY